MITIAAAALLLTESLVLQVPYLPQTENLCGGAAAAMVFRYWGDVHADVAQFAPIVDRRAGGIPDGALVDAITARGWIARRFEGTPEQLDGQLRAQSPVIVLLEDRRDRYHYLVVVGMDEHAIVVHDPSWGPSRRIPREEFVHRWRATKFWSLVIQPRAGIPPYVGRHFSGAEPVSDTTGTAEAVPYAKSTCDQLLDDAVAAIAGDFANAEAILDRVRAQCPDSPGPLRELAGVRFAEHRYTDAAALARAALVKDPGDAYATEVLASSLFLQEDPAGALRAWNRIGKPRVDRVRVDGLQHTRYESFVEGVGITPNTMLTAAAFERAQRRLRELPDRSRARVTIRPATDGYATIDVAVVPPAIVPHGALEWAARGARAAVRRDAEITTPGFTGLGDAWSASARWWNNRPAVGLAFATPAPHRVPGVWRVNVGWQRETFVSPAGDFLREERVHGGLTASDWITGTLRYSLTAGVDSWNGGRKTVSIAGAIDRRWFADRLGTRLGASRHVGLTGDGFHSRHVELTWRSSTTPRRWVYRAASGIQRVSGAAPLSLWPRAGAEDVASFGATEAVPSDRSVAYLRAHPLFIDGVVETRAAVFGGTLTFAGGELQRWFETRRSIRTAIVGFVDAAAAREGLVDVGGGLRVKLPGVEGALRIDAAYGVVDRARALTIGWSF